MFGQRKYFSNFQQGFSLNFEKKITRSSEQDYPRKMFQLLLAQIQNSSSRSSNTHCNLYSNDVSNIRIVRFPIPRTVQFQVPSLVSGPTGRLVLESLFVLDNGGCGVGRGKVRVPAQQQPDLTLLMARLAVIATVLPPPGHAERRSIKSEIAQDDIRDRTCFRFRETVIESCISVDG